MMMELIKSIESLKVSLSAKKEIEIVFDEIKASAPTEFLKKIFLKNNIVFIRLINYFTLFSNNGLAWRTLDTDLTFLNGEFFFPNFQRGKEPFLPNGIYYDIIKGEEFKDDDAFAVLDTHPEAGDGILYFMRFPLGSEDIEVWGLDTKETNLYKLTLNLPQYIAAMCHFKCIYDWQYLFVVYEHRDRLNQNYYDDLLQRLELLKKYFPDIDINKRDF